MEDIYLLRHGEYDPWSGSLTEMGIAQAKSVGAEIGLTLGAAAVLLSSTTPRAASTASIIATSYMYEDNYTKYGFGGLRTALSDRLSNDKAGGNPYVVEDLDAFLVDSLKRANGSTEEDQSLVVVTHAPLIAQALGKSIRQVAHAQPYRYPSGSWVNSDYNERLAKHILSG